MKYSTSNVINPKTSIFKKTTETYHRKSVFNLIDIEESIEKNKVIPFVSKDRFYYNREIDQSDESNTWRKLNDQLNETTHLNCILKLKNSKESVVVINDLNFENENGHKFHFLENYYIIDIIGQGGFGLVLKCWCKKTKKKVAVKIINKKYYTKSILQFFEMEQKFLMGMDHKNILRIIKVLESEVYLILVLELMEWCTLKQLIVYKYENNDPFTEEEVAKIIRNILDGLNYMHSNNIMHRDIKPDNLMFKNIGDLDSLKIIDFGLATFYETKVKKFCGTVKFMAPEIVEDKSYDQTVDIWACGIILYLLCSGGEYPLGVNIGRDISSYKKALNEMKGNWRFDSNFPL